LSKIFSSTADCIVLDCEDGVALNKKKEAREKIRQLFDADERIQNDSSRKYAVRINPSQTNIAIDDIKTIFSCQASQQSEKLFPKCVFVPKTNTVDDILWLYEKLDFQFKKFDIKSDLSLFFYMESAIGLINLNEIIKSSIMLSKEKYNNRFRLEGFVFGSDDFCADVLVTRTKDASELIYARQKMVTYCKAYKLKAIDMVYIDYKGKLNTFS
jgi:citrate lyase subunit beta-like protein